MGRPQEGKSPTISHIWEHHKSMARALVAGGLQPGDLADAYGFSPGQISRILQSPLFQAEVERLRKMADEGAIDAASELIAMKPDAIGVLRDNLVNVQVDRPLKTKTALEVLDRTGHPKTSSPQVNRNLHLHLHKKVEEMDSREIYDAVIGMIEEDTESA